MSWTRRLRRRAGGATGLPRPADAVPSLSRASPAHAASEYRQLLAQRSAQLVRVDQPLVVITQAPRSGGTLLLRLFDGHPECHTVPHELGRMFTGMSRIARASENPWRALTPEQQLERLEDGYRQAKRRLHGDRRSFPFLLPPALQRALFDSCLAGLEEATPRQVMDCYFTSYFNGWLDNANLRAVPKRWVVGFEPATPTQPEKRRRVFRELYPDGRAVSVVRDPWNWFASARRWSKRWRDREVALDDWCAIVEDSLRWQAEDPGRVRVVVFEELVTRTEETMRELAAWLGIGFHPSLLRQTFNGLAISANSSFAGGAAEVSAAPLGRAEAELAADDLEYVAARGEALYERARAAARAPDSVRRAG